MPGTKRTTTKSTSYKEQDDDDDFISKNDNNKKIRDTELKLLTRQPPRKRTDKISKAEQDELDLALQLSKEIVPTNEKSIEISIISDDKESTTSQSTVSSGESKKSEEDEPDENSLPKSKRMKREEEEEEEDDGNESISEEEEINEEEEEQEPTPRKKPIRKTEPTKKNTEIPTVTSLDLNPSRSITRGQEKSSISTTESSTKKSNAPIGFPTSKIVIPSLQTYRVGLSRKSSAIKPLHPNLNQRIVHE